MKQLFILSSLMLITLADSTQVNSKGYFECLQNSCGSYLNNSQSQVFLECTNKIGNCMINQVFSTSYASEFNSNSESFCINTCTQASSQNNQQYQNLYYDLNTCSLFCIENAKSSDSGVNFNVPIFAIIIGIIFVLIICYIVYYFFNKKQSASEKYDWQIQQENNARNQQQFIITPSPLPFLPQNEIYKCKNHQSQLQARVLNDQEVKELYERAYKTFYGDEAGVEGVIQYAIPIFSFPPVQEQNDLIIQEAEIQILEKKDHVVINIEAIQQEQVIIKQKKSEESSAESKDVCVINIRSNQDENLPNQELKLQKSESQKIEQKKCISVHKSSANFSRINKNQSQVQQNWRRLTFV